MTTPRSLPQQPSVRRHVLARDEPQLVVPDVTPSPASVPFESPPAAPRRDGPEAYVRPRFTSTAGHSDFSHGIGDDFTYRLIRPPTQPRRTGPYETSRGNTWNFRAVPPAHTLLRPGTPSTSFAAIVPARYHLDLADRFAIIGYGPALCRKPFRPHLTVGALSCAADLGPTMPSNDHRDAPFCHARRGITPAFGYGPRLGSVRLDFHQLVPCAARRTLRPPPTPTRHATHFPRSSVIGHDAPAATRRPPGRGGPPQFPPPLSGRSTPHTPGGSLTAALPGSSPRPWPSP